MESAGTTVRGTGREQLGQKIKQSSKSDDTQVRTKKKKKALKILINSETYRKTGDDPQDASYSILLHV